MHPYLATTQVKEAWDTKGDMKKEGRRERREKDREGKAREKMEC